MTDHFDTGTVSDYELKAWLRGNARAMRLCQPAYRRIEWTCPSCRQNVMLLVLESTPLVR